MIVMAMRVIFVIFLSFLSSFMSNAVWRNNGQKIALIGGFDSKNAFIRYVDIDGHLYIVKQKKIMTKRLAIVREALAAYIAHDLNIAHSVEIIPSNENIPGKKYPDLPATLHTIAPGKVVREQRDSRYFNLCLKQNSRELLSDQWLNEEIIDQMTWHEQLPIIVALDIFISNADRHGGNLFYDPETDRFCAIDMDCIFAYSVAQFACEKLDLMVNVYKKEFTAEEIKALAVVRDTLKFLVRKYTTKKIIDQMHEFVTQADCQHKASKIARFEVMIKKNRKSVKKLIKILDDIVNNAM